MLNTKKINKEDLLNNIDSIGDLNELSNRFNKFRLKKLSGKHIWNVYRFIVC